MLKYLFAIVASMQLTQIRAMGGDVETLMPFMATQATDWPKSQTSKHTNVTLWENTDDPKDNYLTFNYYVKRLWEYDEKNCMIKEKYQFHGNCFFWGLNYATADRQVDDEFACKWGFYSDDSTIKDWTTVKMVYKGDTVMNPWSCEDGNSDKAVDGFASTADTTKKFNCMVNMDPKKTFVSLDPENGLKVYLQGHFMAEFDPKSAWADNDDDAQDIVLDMNKSFKMDIKFTGPSTAITGGEMSVTGEDVKLLNPMDIYEGTEKCDEKTGASTITVKSVLTLLSSFLLILSVLN